MVLCESMNTRSTRSRSSRRNGSQHGRNGCNLHDPKRVRVQSSAVHETQRLSPYARTVEQADRFNLLQLLQAHELLHTTHVVLRERRIMLRNLPHVLDQH